MRMYLTHPDLEACTSGATEWKLVARGVHMLDFEVGERGAATEQA